MASSRARRCASSLALGLCVITAASRVSLAAGPLRINGSGSALDFARTLVPAFEASHHEHCRVEPPLGSSGAIRALLAGAIDVAVISRPLHPAELSGGARARDYGATPLLFITHAGVPKKDVTVAELEAIFSGEVSKWPDGERIRVVLRPEKETNTELVTAISPGMARADAIARKKPWAIIAVTDPETNQMVEQTPGAIAASTLTSVLTEKLAVNVLALGGVEGSVATLASGKYGPKKPLMFVVTESASPAALAFVELAFSGAGRKLAETVGVLVTARNGNGR